jgi:hypothetical protein
MTRILGCRSPVEVTALDDLAVIVGGGALKASTALDADDRRELIKKSRAGEHIELTLRARTFRQKDGAPNKSYLRLNPAKLSSIAESFAGKPVLLDHRSWSQEARVGTILDSRAEAQGHGWIAFLQTLQVVKPEAVISVLDGTLDRFSIGWSRLGAVMCTAHKVDVTKRGACGCWPGDRVEVDGVKHTVEFEFSDAEGTETSGVNTPAVSGTRIEDVRAALSAEIGLDLERAAGELRVYSPALVAAAHQCGLNVDDLHDEAYALGMFDDDQDEDYVDPASLAALEKVARQLNLNLDDVIAEARKCGQI